MSEQEKVFRDRIMNDVAEKNASIPGSDERRHELGIALVLAIITIVYNLLEGMASTYFGIKDETVVLFGFGLDSFVEIISGIGILHMVVRMRRAGKEEPDRFEQSALKVTGAAFYLLAAGIAATSVYTLYAGHKPDNTFWGVVISLVSILTMWLLIHFKMRIGMRLKSDAIIADAKCTRACMQLSFILLIASAGYAFTGIGGLDATGGIIIAVISLREGREAFQKARGKACACGGSCKPSTFVS